MKKKLLSIVLAISTLLTCMFAFSGCGVLDSLGDLGKKDGFTKAVEAVMDNCTIEVRGMNISAGGQTQANPQNFTYKFTETRVYLFAPTQDDVAATWVAEGGTYKYWKMTTSSMTWQGPETRTKTEYNNARKNSFDLFFGYFTKKSSLFVLNEAKTQYTNSAPVEIKIGEGSAAMTYTYTNVLINLTDGAIRSATYDLSLSYSYLGVQMVETYTGSVNFIGSTSVDIPNA